MHLCLIFLIFSSLKLSIVNSQQIDPNNPLVNTTLGVIRGRKYDFKSKFNQRTIVSFIGIPYAKKIDSNNRFMLPEPLEPWEGEKYATDNRIMCPQVEQRFSYILSKPIKEDEDCLFLNVFVPSTPRPYFGFPVMFYIHGGEFKFGGKDFYYPDYLLDNDVILVTINYRLGILGFLSTSDSYVPGNIGVHDQIAALRWVSNNIKSFGGNSQNITIFGHDAGAISASILQFSVHSWRLFHKLIISGSSVFSPHALSPNPLQQAINFGKLIGCPIKHDDNNQIFPPQFNQNLSTTLVNCLRTKSFNELMSVSRTKGIESGKNLFWFRPVIDQNSSRPLLVNSPSILYEQANLWVVPMIVGMTLNEGSLDYFTYYDKIRYWPVKDKIRYIFSQYQDNALFEKILVESINWFYFKRWNSTQTNKINYSYQIPYNPSSFYLTTKFPYTFDTGRSWFEEVEEERKLINTLGDFLFASPVSFLGHLHSEIGALTYMYVLEHRGLKSFGPIQHNGSTFVHRNQYGVSHMDDVFYLFPTEYNNNSTSSFDEPIIRTMCQHLTHFALHGRFAQVGQLPTSNIGHNWFPYDDQKQSYARFATNFGYGQVIQSGEGFRSEYVSFWNYFIRQVLFSKELSDSNIINGNQISARFLGTVQLNGIIKLGSQIFNIS